MMAEEEDSDFWSDRQEAGVEKTVFLKRLEHFDYYGTPLSMVRVY